MNHYSLAAIFEYLHDRLNHHATWKIVIVVLSMIIGICLLIAWLLSIS